jgi:hypothetical protein
MFPVKVHPWSITLENLHYGHDKHTAVFLRGALPGLSFSRSVVYDFGFALPVQGVQRDGGPDDARRRILLMIPRYFRVRGSALRHIRALGIPASVTRLSKYSIFGCDTLSLVTFESGSRLSIIGSWAFAECLLLVSICFPASVERIGEACFWDCRSLLFVSFEDGSKIAFLGTGVFGCCSPGLSFSGPPALDDLLVQAAEREREGMIATEHRE